MMDGRNAKNSKRKHDFVFSGLIACHACGCAVVGEIKKECYVYYHCTGYADKCQGTPASCRRHYVREELLEKQFTELLGRLKFDDEVLAWVREALHATVEGAELGEERLLGLQLLAERKTRVAVQKASRQRGAGAARQRDRRGTAPRRMLEIQSGVPEIYRRKRRPALLLAPVLIN